MFIIKIFWQSARIIGKAGRCQAPGRTKKWAQRDSDPWPTGYEPVALTRLSYGPDKLFRYENMYKGFEKRGDLSLESLETLVLLFADNLLG